MKGFLQRDWSLLRINLWFYLIFILGASLFAIFTEVYAGFINTYLIVFSTISVKNLFFYDEANRWQAYAVATPDGRKAMVDARYVLAACIGIVVMAIQFLVGTLSWSGEESVLLSLGTTSVYGGVFFCYTAIVLPVFYRFGSVRSQLALVIMIGVLAGTMVGVSSLMSVQSAFPRCFLAVGVAALLISWSISRAIVGEKEY